MKKLAPGLLILAALATLAAAPTTARAGVVFELSGGAGARLRPEPIERTPTNIMFAGGFSFAGMLKLELGLVGNLTDVKDSKFDLGLRPMLVISPPLVPLYVRGIVAVNGLVDGPVKYQYGGALGLSFGLFGIGVFLEAGYVPGEIEVVQPDGTTKKERAKLAEGRLGAYWD
jgi:hypothetical protein